MKIRLLQDDILRHLLKNAGTLLSGNVTAAILGFISLSIAARALGRSQLGVLALIQAYVMVVDRLVNFQSWQALIKYGAESMVQKDSGKLAGFVKLSTILDASSALIGSGIAVGGGDISSWMRPNEDV